MDDCSGLPPTGVELTIRRLYGELGADIALMLIAGWSPNRIVALIKAGSQGIPDGLLEQVLDYAIKKITALKILLPNQQT